MDFRAENKKLKDQIIKLNLDLKKLNQENNFSSFFVDNKAIMLQVDIETQQIINANNSALLFYGYSKEEMMQMTMDDLQLQPIHSKSNEKSKGVIKKSERLEYKHILSNNKIKDVEIYDTPFSSHGKTTIFLTIHDISDRKKAEKALKNSEEKCKNITTQFRLMTDNAPDLVWAKDLEGRFTFVNRAVCKSLLIAKDINEPIGKNDMFFVERQRKLFPKNKDWHTFGEVCVNSDEVILNTKKPHRFEEYGNVQGKFLFLDVYKAPIFNDDGIMVGTVGLGRDVTKEKEIEKKLIESENRFKALSEATNEAIFISFKGVCIETNEAATRMFGYSYNELIGIFGTDVIAPESKEFVKQKMLAGYNKPYDAIALRKDGTKFHAEFHGRMFEYNGQQTRITAVRNISFRKKIEQDLKDSKEFFKEITENISDAISVVDKSGISKYRSASFKRVMGYNAEERLGVNVFDYVYPEDKNKIMSQFYNSLKKPGVEKKISFRAFHKDGSLRYLEGTGKNMINSPVIKGIVVNYRDVTDRILAEEALKESESKYKVVADFNYDWEYWVDENGKFKYVSPSCERITGYKPEDFYKDSNLIRKMIYPEDLEAFNNHSHKIDKNGHRESFDFRIINRNNEIRWIGHVCRTIYDENGKLLGTRGSNRDITDRKKADEILIESESRFHAIFFNNPNPTHLIDKDFNILSTNSVILKLKNLKQSDIVGKKCYEAYQNSDKICDNCVIEKVKESKKSSKSENRLQLPDGSYKYFETYAYPIFDSNHNVSQIVETTIDITEDKLSEKALKESEAKLKESNKTKDKFFSIIAHDLKSPFNSLLGFSKLLKNNFGIYTPKEQIEFIEIIHNGILNTYKLLENLLLWSRTQRGNMKFNPEIINLRSLTSELAEVLQHSCQKKSITCYNDIPAEHSLYADKEMLSTIIRNLISNAIKFTPKNGKIQIKSKPVELENKHNGLEISIIDNGIGIPSQRHSKIFKIGECNSTPGTENEKGTGLGLILCKEFVEKHEGKIWVESEPEKGSEFKFILPVTPKRDKEIEDLSKVNKETYKILIAEDEYVNYIFIDLLLKHCELNLETIHAINGLEAVEFCKNNSDIDLVLMDIRMPIMDGYDAIKEIRKFNKNLSIIVLSAQAEPQDINKAIKAGSNAFISKPLEESKLLNILKQYLISK